MAMGEVEEHSHSYLEESFPGRADLLKFARAFSREPTMASAEREFDMTYPTVRKRLDDLEDEGLMLDTGKTRDKEYFFESSLRPLIERNGVDASRLQFVTIDPDLEFERITQAYREARTLTGYAGPEGAGADKGPEEPVEPTRDSSREDPPSYTAQIYIGERVMNEDDIETLEEVVERSLERSWSDPADLRSTINSGIDRRRRFREGIYVGLPEGDRVTIWSKGTREDVRPLGPGYARFLDQTDLDDEEEYLLLMDLGHERRGRILQTEGRVVGYIALYAP